jgi:hypothetical protein
MSNNTLQRSQSAIKTLSETVQRAYAHARSLGYTGSSLEYAMLILPEDTLVTDNTGYSGTLRDTPSISELLNI